MSRDEWLMARRATFQNHVGVWKEVIVVVETGLGAEIKHVECVGSGVKPVFLDELS
tara:strand:+ start:189 stop:356 length:168 start_codon:yes stop_codon:yes gene_type:complete